MISVNTGQGKDAGWAGKLRRTAIGKRPTAGRAEVGRLGLWMDERHWVKRFAGARRPGAYLRVLREGAVGTGDRLEVVSRPAEQVTLAESMTAYYRDAALMRRLLRVEGRGLDWDNIAPGGLRRAAARS